MTNLKNLKIILLLLLFASTAFSQDPVGLFTGTVPEQDEHKNFLYDTAKQIYQLSPDSKSENNNYQYVYRKLKGDFILQTRAVFNATAGRQLKLGWMVRSNLDSSAKMARATLFGNGEIALQFREAKDGKKDFITSSVKNPDLIQLEREGDQFIMSVANFGDPWTKSAVKTLDIGSEVFVGLFVSSTEKDKSVSFSNVRIILPAKEDLVPYQNYLASYVELLDVTTGHRQVVHTDPGSVQAPNWSPDNKYLIYNSSEGLMYRFDLKKRKPEQIDTDYVTANNNDHVISFDGNMLGLSSSSGKPEYGSLIYTVPIAGGKPVQITPTGPSYLHGWSPDGKWLTYTGLRNEAYDIYKIPVTGGKEIQLTTAPGLDDGSEYSPDGKFIYFNSVRTGKMELWRMKPNGKNQEQLTDDKFNNWFPHISPDGKWIVFLSYMEDVTPDAHPFYKPVYLRMMPAGGGAPKVIAYFYGGQGSINTPSWSPDSKKVAFVSNTHLLE